MKYLKRYGIPLAFISLLVAAGLFLPHYALKQAIRSFGELQFAFRSLSDSSKDVDDDSFAELQECLKMQTGTVEKYTLKAEDLDAEATEHIVREMLRLLDFPEKLTLSTAETYGYAASVRGIWSLEFQDPGEHTLRVSLDTQSGVLLSLEYDAALPLSSEQQTAILDLYSEWQIYFPDQPSRTSSESTIWLSGQNFGLELLQESESFALHLFFSGSY